jgi:hypothetical protein
MLDALMAVMISALGLGIILTCIQISLKSSDLGFERREALARLQVLIEATPRKALVRQSRAGAFTASVRVEPVSEGSARFCKISAQLTSLRSKRSYSLSGLRWCAADSGAML